MSDELSTLLLLAFGLVESPSLLCPPSASSATVSCCVASGDAGEVPGVCGPGWTSAADARVAAEDGDACPVGAEETVEAPLEAAVAAASCLGETESDVTGGDDAAAAAGEVSAAVALSISAGGGAAVVELLVSSTIKAGSDEGTWTWVWSRSEVMLGGVGGAVLEVQMLSVPGAHTVVDAPSAAVTLDEAPGPSLEDGRTAAAGAQDSRTTAGELSPAAVVVTTSGSCC